MGHFGSDVGTQKVTLTYVDHERNNNKFYEVSIVDEKGIVGDAPAVEPWKVVYRWGRRGTSGQSRVERYRTQSGAFGNANAKIDAKLAKGYVKRHHLKAEEEPQVARKMDAEEFAKSGRTFDVPFPKMSLVNFPFTNGFTFDAQPDGSTIMKFLFTAAGETYGATLTIDRFVLRDLDAEKRIEVFRHSADKLVAQAMGEWRKTIRVQFEVAPGDTNRGLPVKAKTQSVANALSAGDVMSALKKRLGGA